MLKISLITTFAFLPLSCEQHNSALDISNNNPPINKVIVKKKGSKISKKSCQGDRLLKLKTQLDDGFSYLAFPNFGRFGIGRCRGHALLTQKLSILATFKTGPICDLRELECFSEVRKGVGKILNYQTHTFVGHKNLWEFSSEPNIKKYLRAIVAGTSHRFRSRSAKISVKKFSTPQANMYGEVQKRLIQGHLPYVALSGLQTGAHAVLIYGESVAENKNVLCARDPNFVGTLAESCENYLYMDEDHKIFFKREEKTPDLMQTFLLTGDEEVRVSKYKKALSRKCLQ